jgi:hypothetical protein
MDFALDGLERNSLVVTETFSMRLIGSALAFHRLPWMVNYLLVAADSIPSVGLCLKAGMD